MKPVTYLRSAVACLAVALLAACSTTGTAPSNTSGSSSSRTASGSATGAASSTASRAGGAASGAASGAAAAASAAGRSTGAGAINTATSYFPSGMKEGSALAVTKVSPREIIMGQPASYRLELKNVSDVSLKDVTITDTVSPNFKVSSATPQPASSKDGKIAWNIASLAPGQTAVITVSGSAEAQGVVEHCATASYTPTVCAETRVVEPAISIDKSLPAMVSSCDPIPMQIVVRNKGTSRLTNVKISDALPQGLALAEGGTTYTQDVGNLEAGQSREFMVNLKATSTGKFTNTASATSSEGVTAKDSAEITVVQPKLTLVCDAPDKRFAGRPIEICLTVANVGDGASADTQVVMNLPAGAKFNSATQGGTLQGNSVVWTVGSLAPQTNRKLCLTTTPETQGTFTFSSTARGKCASPETVNASCSTTVSGIPAILLEVIDLADPIEVGNTQTYEIAVTNQGTAPATNVKINGVIEDTQSFISITGATSGTGNATSFQMQAVPSIAPKQRVVWRVMVKAEKAGDVRFKVVMNSAELTRPVEETESTTQY